jgi:membrane protease YdiL (CAAX protease family)
MTHRVPPLREVIVVYAVVAVITAVLGAIRGMPWAADIASLGIAALFLGTPLAMARRVPGGAARLGIELGGLLDPPDTADPRPSGPFGVYDLARTIDAALPDAIRETAFALGLAAIIFPPFVVGFFLWHGPSHAFAFHLAPDFGSFVISQFVLVGLPEEALFRGYVQTRLGDHFTRTTRVLGTDVSLPALVIQAALFALVHLATEPSAEKLAVFFPGLLFGWMRARRGGIGASIVFHAASNIIAEILVTGWLA